MSILIQDQVSLEKEEKVLSTECTMDRHPGAILVQAAKFYAFQAQQIRVKVEDLAIELRGRQERIRFLHNLIQEINALSQVEGKEMQLDFGLNQEAQEKLRMAAEMGVKIPILSKSHEPVVYKTSYSLFEKEKLLENIHLSADELDKDNKLTMQRITLLVQETDRYVMLASQVMKYEQKAKQGAVQGMR